MDKHSESPKEFVVRKLREVMPKSWPEVSRFSGVPEKTIYKIAYGETQDPRSSTVDALYRYFVDGLIENDRRAASDRRAGPDRRENRRKAPRRATDTLPVSDK